MPSKKSDAYHKVIHKEDDSKEEKIAIYEELIELMEAVIQKERFAGAPYAISQIISHLKGRIEELKDENE